MVFILIQGIVKVGYRWTVAEVDHDLGKYLRSMFLMARGVKLERPSHKEHITIVSEYEEISEIQRQSLLQHDKKNIEFTLLWDVFTNGNAYWMPIDSIDIKRIRESILLPEQPLIPLHFCIGYVGENNENQKSN